MTALQWITTEAKKLKKKFPKKEWKDLVAQASAIYSKKHKGKSPVGKKKSKVGAVKKVTKKKNATKKASSIHKDTKSHNVRISVVSGFDNEKLIRKLASKFLRLSGYNQMAKDVTKKNIPISNVWKAVDYVTNEKIKQVEQLNYSKALKEKAQKTKIMWEAYKKAYLK